MTRELLDGVDFFLLSERADWSHGFKATFELPVSAETGLSNRETRRPLGSTLRTRLEFAVVANGAGVRALAAGLRELRDEPVAVPFWPGAVLWKDRASAPFGSLWRLAITSAGDTFEAWSDVEPGWPADNDWHVPLLLGRMESRPATWLSADACRFAVEFEDKSAADFALTVAAASFTAGPSPSGGSPPVLLPFQVDFDQPKLGVRVEVERERIGLGREEAVTFYDHEAWQQGTAKLSLPSAADAARFVSFFSDHGAGVPFWLPLWAATVPLDADIAAGETEATVAAGHGFNDGDWVFFAFGFSLAFAKVTGTTATTLSLDRAVGAWTAGRALVGRLVLTRTERPRITVEWFAPSSARVSFDVREVPEEYEPDAGETAGTTLGVLRPRAYLFDLTVRTTGGDIVRRFTSHERDLTVDGNAYVAAPIEQGDIRQGVALDRDEVEVTAAPEPGDTSHPLVALAALASDWPVFLTVRAVTL